MQRVLKLAYASFGERGFRMVLRRALGCKQQTTPGGQRAEQELSHLRHEQINDPIGHRLLLISHTTFSGIIRRWRPFPSRCRGSFLTQGDIGAFREMRDGSLVLSAPTRMLYTRNELRWISFPLWIPATGVSLRIRRAPPEACRWGCPPAHPLQPQRLLPASNRLALPVVQPLGSHISLSVRETTTIVPSAR
jgi:hypothetical protein